MNLRVRGFGVIGWIVTIPLVLIALVISVIGFYEGRKAYWDNKISEMCIKDGGMTIRERIVISQAEYTRLGGKAGVIPVPSERNISSVYPIVSKHSVSVLHESNPRVYRSESQYLRQSDQKVIATLVQYSRVGGDLPTYAHPSSFACPDSKKAAESEREIFVIQGISQ